VIEALPPTESDEFAVACSTTNGIGALTTRNPQPALAEMLKVLVAETSLVNDIGTGSVILTFT
jgi:hypothetical protein